jgi:hypothetical protein
MGDAYEAHINACLNNHSWGDCFLKKQADEIKHLQKIVDYLSKERQEGNEGITALIGENKVLEDRLNAVIKLAEDPNVDDAGDGEHVFVWLEPNDVWRTACGLPLHPDPEEKA